MTQIRLLIAALSTTLVLVSSSIALAQNAPPAASQSTPAAPPLSAKPLTPAEAQMKKNVEDHFKITIDEITALPFGGMYELRVGPKVLYSDAKGQYLLIGNLIDVNAETNLTKVRTEALEQAALPKFKFADLPFASAIRIVKGSGKRQMAVFEDPNCVYCKRLEHSLQSLNDVTIFVFLYPVLGEDSVAKSKGIWCAKDPAKTWLQWMDAGVPIAPAGNCSTSSIDQNLALGDKLQVTGTPTILFQDGERAPGAISIEDITKMLNAG